MKSKYLKYKIILVLTAITVMCSVFYAAGLDQDARHRLESIRMASVVYDRHGKLIGNLYQYRRVWVPINSISSNLQKAVVAIEDKRFYQHKGFDIRSMGRALVHDLFSGGGMEGGSTITQQLAKISLLSS